MTAHPPAPTRAAVGQYGHEINAASCESGVDASDYGGREIAAAGRAESCRSAENVQAVPSILAIDPGPVQSGWCVFDGSRLVGCGVDANHSVLANLVCAPYEVLAIERIASYGMAVGREVFETCEWVGRFVQNWTYPEDVRLVYRKDVKLHLCGSPRAKDANIRQALIDLFPATGGGKVPQIGIKSKPGPLFGVSSHAWPALAVAVTVAAQLEKESA